MMTPRHLSTPVMFWLDPRDEIVRVSRGWNEFAQDNDGASCLETDVVGRPLFSFITGSSARMLVGALLLRSRALETTVEWDYRCDSPQMKRFMRMRVVPDDGLLRLEHRIVRTLPLLPPLTCYTSTSASKRAVVRCSACNRFRVGENWLEPDEALARDAVNPLQAVIHDACPDCLSAVLPRPVAV